MPLEIEANYSKEDPVGNVITANLYTHQHSYQNNPDEECKTYVSWDSFIYGLDFRCFIHNTGHDFSNPLEAFEDGHNCLTALGFLPQDN